MAGERERGEVEVRREGPKAMLGQVALDQAEITEQEMSLVEVRIRKSIFVTVIEAL